MKIVRREIGSEFWDVPQNEFQRENWLNNASWFLSGRAALECVIKDAKEKRGMRSVAIPAYCCESVIVPFLRNGIEVKFYPVYMNASGVLEQNLEKACECDALLTIDFFGYQALRVSGEYKGIILRDATHSFFNSLEEIMADYTFASLRKWAGFYTGGVAWSKIGILAAPKTMDEHYINLRRHAMKQKLLYMTGQREDKGYLSIFEDAEHCLEKRCEATAAPEDINAAKYMDVDFIQRRRRENAGILLDAVSDLAVFRDVPKEICPLFVPICVPNGKRDALRRHLIDREIYCPTHWPVSKYHEIDNRTQQMYDEELSLICDQRYDAEDMCRICDAIADFCV